MTTEALMIPDNTTKQKKQKRPRTTKGQFKAKNDHLREWALSGIGVMAFLSAILNGYAHSQSASVSWAGWAMGLIIPVLVLIIFKVAGSGYHREYKRFGFAMGLVGFGVLLLSLYHCAFSIAELTGSPLYLAWPMALAIDCGLVGCEIACLLD